MKISAACSSENVVESGRPESQALSAASGVISTDSEGNTVRNEGWFSNNFHRGKLLRRTTYPAVTKDGRTISVIREDFEYPDELIIPDALEGISPSFGLGRTNWGSETRGSNSSRAFCISTIIHPVNPPRSRDNSFHDHGISISYCDADGDAIFETRPGPTFGVPSWVK